MIPILRKRNKKTGSSVDDDKHQNHQGHVEPSPKFASKQQQPCGKCTQNEHEIRQIKNKMTTMDSLLQNLINAKGDSKDKMPNQCANEIQTILSNNNKMAAKLQAMELIMEEITEENTQKRNILSLQAHEWNTVNYRKSPASKKPVVNKKVISRHLTPSKSSKLKMLL